jgi:AraC-like DNA-binding protein
MPALVRAAALGNYPEVARRVGLDPERMLRAAGLDPAALSNPDLRIPTAAVVNLLEESARQSGCPTLGLQMAESWRLSDFGVISLMLTHQRTLRDALETTIRYRHLLNDSLSLSIEEAGELVIVREELVGGSAARSRQAIELAIGVVFRMFSALLGSQWKPRSVRFTHPAPPALDVHRRIFGPNTEFNQAFNGIVCAAADLDRPNPAADPAMAGHAKRIIDTMPGARTDGTSVAQDVRRAIHILLPQGQASIEQIAQGLGITTRTLQRQLDESGESYSALLNEARRELVPRYLENPAYSLTQVGELLGYEFPSSFTRWFTKEFGVAPARWRAEHSSR